jgi:hypothetical protein
MRDLPDSHVHLVFAVILLRNGMLSHHEFRGEATAAFGDDAGTDIADRLLRRFGAGAVVPSEGRAPQG